MWSYVLYLEEPTAKSNTAYPYKAKSLWEVQMSECSDGYLFWNHPELE